MTKNELTELLNSFDVEKVDYWECPSDNGVPILTMPNIPMALHGNGLQPRTIFGRTTWDFMRKAAYKKAGYASEISGEVPEKGYLHCLEAGTEVLTSNGFKPIELMTLDDTVAQYEPQDRKISWVKPLETVKTPVSKIVTIGYKDRFRVGYSDKHRMLIEHTKNYNNNGYEKTISLDDVYPEDLTFSGSNRIPTAGYAKHGRGLTPDERIYIALNADGCWQYESNGLNYHVIRVKKERKKERLVALLKESSLRHNRLFEKDRADYLGMSIWTKENCKDFWNVFDLTAFTQEMAKDFIDELCEWDGWKGKRKNGAGKSFDGKCWYTTKKSQADFVQAVAALAGITTTVSITDRKTRNECLPQINIEFLSRDSRGTTTMTRTVAETDTYAYCIRVPSTYFVARSKDGYVFITGNSHELFSYDYALQEGVFIRCIALSKMEHDFIHSGRLITLYRMNNPMIPKSYLLKVVENGFRLVHEYNEAHPDQEPLRVYATFLEYLDRDDLRDEMVELIRKYDIKFYKEHIPKGKRWKGWHVIVGNKRYNSPYRCKKDWEEAMKEMNKRDNIRSMSNPFQGKGFDMVDEILKANVVTEIPGCKPGRLSKRKKETS